MEPKKRSSGLIKMVIVSAVTAVVVFIVLAVVGLGGYYYWCCATGANRAEKSTDEGVADRLKRAGRTLTGSATDASKITSVAFSTWSHAGPLYPPPNEPPGYVSSGTVAFRRDLTAQRTVKKDYDRDLPDEVRSESGTLTAEQFEKLVAICVEIDVINEPDSEKVISEGGATLMIEYGGAKETIVTSNYGLDTEGMKKLLGTIDELKSSIKWVPAE